MKKPYEKPQLIALSLKANDALCACDVDPDTDPGAGRWDWSDPSLFEENACDIGVGQYCKMTSTSNIVFNS